MPVTVVVGGQYGSEGKGKVAAFFARYQGAKAAIRCGGSNSGHTVYDNGGKKFIFRQLPTACLQSSVVNILISGFYIDIDILLSEIELAKIKPSRLCIDPYAVIITDKHKREELNSGLKNTIGSTGSGTGAAIKQRLLRSKDIIFAKDVPRLESYISDSKTLIHRLLLEGERIILEGTQGYGLSLLHSKEYPYVTARDTTAAGFISEAGISPFDIDDIVLVIRTFPIRVSGNSGPLKNEISWGDISIMAGNEIAGEITSVTKQIRRVGLFENEIVNESIRVNKPTQIILNHMDYINDCDKSNFILGVEKHIGCSIDWIGLNPYNILHRNSNLVSISANN